MVLIGDCQGIDRAFQRLKPRLSGALRQNLQNFERDTGSVCSFQIEGTSHTLPPILEFAVYRIAQEALANVRKHAQADKVDVILRFEADDLCLKVRDNGKGFDTSRLSETEALGVAGMRERAGLVGGVLEVQSQPGKGTRVNFIVPVDGQAGVVQ